MSELDSWFKHDHYLVEIRCSPPVPVHDGHTDKSTMTRIPDKLFLVRPPMSRHTSAFPTRPASAFPTRPASPSRPAAADGIAPMPAEVPADGSMHLPQNTSLGGQPSATSSGAVCVVRDQDPARASSGHLFQTPFSRRQGSSNGSLT